MNPLEQLAPPITPAPPDWWPLAPGWWLLAALLLGALLLGWRRWHRANRAVPPPNGLDPLRQAALEALHQLAKPLPGESASHWLQQLNALLKRLCRTRYPADHPHTMSGRTWLAFLDSRCPSAGLTRWMILVDGAYRAECRLDNDTITGLERAVEIWIKTHA